MRNQKVRPNAGKRSGCICSVHFIKVEFDDVAIRVEDVDLREAGERRWTELHLAEVSFRNIVAKSLVAKPRQRITIALHAQCKMNVVGVVRLFAANRRLGTDDDVQLLLPVADLVPDSRIGESG